MEIGRCDAVKDKNAESKLNIKQSEMKWKEIKKIQIKLRDEINSNNIL